MIYLRRFAWLCASLILLTTPTHAEDLGKRGQSYSADPSGADQLRDLARKKQQSPDMARFWQDYRARTIDSIKHPRPLGIPTSLDARTESHELKFQFQSDFRDEKGRVLVKKGTVVEPLKIRPMLRRVLFIDGRDQSQIDYAIKEGKLHPLKIVLTAGSPFDLRVRYQNEFWMGAKGIPFYFDQRKMIITSLRNLYGIRIASVPAELYQEGTNMIIKFGVSQ